MFPYFTLFGRVLGLYPIMALCGVLSAGFFACFVANKLKYDYTDLIIFVLIIALGAVIGTHLFYAIVGYENFVLVFKNLAKINSVKDVLIVFNFLFGGSVYYGALLGGILAGYIAIRKNNKYGVFPNIVAMGIPLFHFFGRIGCFLGGCCYGIECKIGFIYTKDPIIEANGVRRFPVQLLEASFNILLFLFLNYLFWNKKAKAKANLLIFYLIAYSIARFFLEFLRGDTERGIWGPFSTSQIISLCILLVLAIHFLIIRYKSRNKSPTYS